MRLAGASLGKKTEAYRIKGFAINSREKAPVQNKRLASANLAMRSPKHKLSRRGQGPIRKKTRIRVLKVQSVNVVLLCTVPDLMLEIR
jgi:hypothetical protein